MRQEFFTLELVTNGQKLYEFTENTLHWINDLNLNNGLLNLKGHRSVGGMRASIYNAMPLE